MNPKVIALDIQLPDADSSEDDQLLRAALMNCERLVLPLLINNYTGADISYTDILGCDPYFLEGHHSGFVNVLSDTDKFETVSRVSISETVNGKKCYNFALMTAMLFDSAKVSKYLANKPKIIPVHYRRNQNDFPIIMGYRAMRKEIDPEEIEGKIVLIGSFAAGHGVDYPDIFFSPLNDRRDDSPPDMWGVMYQANVIDQVLND